MYVSVRAGGIAGMHPKDMTSSRNVANNGRRSPGVRLASLALITGGSSEGMTHRRATGGSNGCSRLGLRSATIPNPIISTRVTVLQ